MEIKNEIKSILAINGWTMTEVVNELNKKYGRNDSVQNLSKKLSKETIRYKEIKEIADVLGFELNWVNKKEEE
jgi:transposase